MLPMAQEATVTAEIASRGAAAVVTADVEAADILAAADAVITGFIDGSVTDHGNGRSRFLMEGLRKRRTSLRLGNESHVCCRFGGRSLD